MLGTNDTKPQNWKRRNEFIADDKDLLGQFAELPIKLSVSRGRASAGVRYSPAHASRIQVNRTRALIAARCSS